MAYNIMVVHSRHACQTKFIQLVHPLILPPSKCHPDHPLLSPSNLHFLLAEGSFPLVIWFIHLPCLTAEAPTRPLLIVHVGSGPGWLLVKSSLISTHPEATVAGMNNGLTPQGLMHVITPPALLLFLQTFPDLSYYPTLSLNEVNHPLPRVLLPWNPLPAHLPCIPLHDLPPAWPAARAAVKRATHIAFLPLVTTHPNPAPTWANPSLWNF